MKRVALLLALAALLLGGVSAAAAPPHDYAAVALDVLPPGENGGVAFDRNTTDQAALYDGLTPLYDKVGNADLKRWFKPETLGLGGLKAVRTEKLPRTGVVIQRDGWDVPHVTGKTQADVEYGAGWATAEDRGLLLGLIRGPGPGRRARHPRDRPDQPRPLRQDVRAERRRRRPSSRSSSTSCGRRGRSAATS